MSGKRANIFGQGRPEKPYEERDEDAVDVPQRATAAQLAARKIKAPKGRRPAGGASTPSQSANFGTPQQQPGFTFGASAPAVGGNNNNNNTNGLFGASISAFGGGATNSFPPAQSSAPSNSFVSSSFPAFGASSQSTGFNPQPPTVNDFNFTAGSSNPFAVSNAPATNGNSTPTAFGGASIFSSQVPSNPFAGLSQNITTSAPSTGSMFGGSISAPSNNMFGTTSSAANAMSTPAPAPTPFSFGAISSSAQPASTPATSNTFGGFGTTQGNAAPAQNSIFSGFGANAQNGNTVQQETPQKSLFGISAPATDVATTTATAPSSNLFGFSSNAQSNPSTTSTAPPTNMFGAAPTPSAPASNPFGQLAKAPSSSTPSFAFGQQTPQAQEKAPSTVSNPFGAIKLPEEGAATAKTSLFSSLKAPEPTTSASSETPKPNLFSSMAKPPSSTSTSGFSIFGTAQNKDTGTETSKKLSEAPASKAPEADTSSLFRNGFSTPQPAKNSGAEKPQAGLFSAAQPKTTSSGLFSQTFQPEKSNVPSASNTTSTFSAFKPQTASSTEAPKDTSTQSTPTKEASNPFSSISAPSTERPNLFAPQKGLAPSPTPSSMPTLTGSAPLSIETSNGPELPKVPKAHVPKEWAVPSTLGTQDMDNMHKVIVNLTLQLQQLNERYRAKLGSLSSSADWSALSLWHHQHSSAIKKKIDAAKKQRAAEKGITGHESVLSTKRKVNEEPQDSYNVSPSKRSRPTEAPATPAPQSTTPAPKFNPPATATSNIFAKAINNKPSASSEQTNMFAPKTTLAPADEPAKPNSHPPSSMPFGSVATPTSLSAFKPTSNASSSGSVGFKPVTTGGGGGFASQFAATAKTYEQLAAERKKKAMDEDYDSDDETKEEWSARYDKQEAERIAKEKAAAAAAPAFSLPAFGKTPDTSTPASNPFASMAKPASGTSTPGLFGSRPASPALSTTGSVFAAPSTAQTPSSNIFGHLSSAASSNGQDESDDDGEHAAQAPQPAGSAGPTTPPKRKLNASENEATESIDETAKRQKHDTASKGSLFSRITRSEDDGSESEKENNESMANGTHTPANKPFAFFDFGAAGAQTAPPKTDTFAGDQTFKPGTPIKFGEVAATEKKAAPTFQFQAPSASTTPSKPPPTNLFNFASSSGSSLLAPNASLSGLNSAPSSTFSSRAATPLSEADNSAAEDEEEGNKHEQVDLSKLTPEELAANDVMFETEQALAKHQVDQGDGTKAWENFARGPLYILKDKVTGKCFVRIRLPSGQIPLNYSILPKLKTAVTGSSLKMVQAIMPKKEGGIAQIYISLKTKELAKEFSETYNASVPS